MRTWTLPSRDDAEQLLLAVYRSSALRVIALGALPAALPLPLAIVCTLVREPLVHTPPHGRAPARGSQLPSSPRLARAEDIDVPWEQELLF